jgi:hypothetical protein
MHDLFGEADEETVDEPRHDHGRTCLAVVDRGEVQHVERQRDGDGDPHPAAAADRLRPEQLTQPAERHRREPRKLVLPVVDHHGEQRAPPAAAGGRRAALAG